MASGPAELALWSVVLPGAVGTVCGLLARRLGVETTKDSKAPVILRRAITIGLPTLAAIFGYWAAQVTHRGWPTDSPLVMAWPPLAEFSGSQWVIWLVSLAGIVGVAEAALSSSKIGQPIARWGGRLLVSGVLLWTMMRSVAERDFDSAGLAAVWFAGVGGLLLLSSAAIDVVSKRSGVRPVAAGLSILGTAAAVALFQAGSAPQAQVLGGLLAVLGGFAVIGGSRAAWIAGPVSTIWATSIVGGAVVGHFYVYPEFDAWVWGAVALSPIAMLAGSAPVVRKLGPIKRATIRLAAAGVIAGGLIAYVGVPTPPGAETTPYSY